MPTERLLAGQAVHKAVQSAFRNGLAGAFWERPWRLVAGRRGRVDLGVELDDRDSRMLVVIEIKGTNWNKIPAGRVTRNVRRHLGQLQDYLDTAVEDMEAGSWNAVTGGLLYPARPARAEAVEVRRACPPRVPHPTDR